jgi:hypothetical protein
VLSQQYNT